MRAPFNVLVLPYCQQDQKTLFCVFKRADMAIWQFVAGGGEDEEDFLSSAKRECNEEAGVDYDCKYLSLETMGYVSADNFSLRARAAWGNKYVIPVYTFGVEVPPSAIRIGREHSEYRWCTYEQARGLLHFDLDKTALYELHERIKEGSPSVL